MCAASLLRTNMLGLLVCYVLASSAAAVTTKSLRICRPPPPRPAVSNGGAGRVCLVVGDSVSLGYTGPLTKSMAAACDVVHAPFSGDGGACDTRYGLQCAEMWWDTALALCFCYHRG